VSDKASDYVLRRATVDDARAVATVQVESWKSSYQGILAPEFLAALNVERRTEGWAESLAEPGRAAFLGLTAGGKVVAFCDAGPNRDEPKTYRGEVYAIYLLDEAKRQGLGRALLRETAAWLAQGDMRSFVVWVLTANFPAQKFYEALGGEQVAGKPIVIAGVAYTELAYGWPDGMG